MLSDDQCLCWDCARHRGGEYDTESERWGTAPRLDDLGGSEQN